MNANLAAEPSLEKKFRDFVETVTGDRVCSLEPHTETIGFSRIIWFARTESAAGVTCDFVLRHDNGSGPFSVLKNRTLGQEARVVSAAASAGIRVPRIYAVNEAGTTILMERLAGCADYRKSRPPDRAALMDQVCSNLALLHSLDADAFPFSDRVKSDLPHDLNEYADAYRSLCEPVPQLEDTLGWLAENMPDSSVRPVVLHGDAGPGNFMFEGDRLTGLIDWEMAHAGDPMEELATLYFRICVTGMPEELADWFRSYCRVSCTAYRPEAVEYFRMLQFAKAALVTTLLKLNEPELSARLSLRSMPRVEAGLRWTQGDPSALAALNLPPVPHRI